MNDKSNVPNSVADNALIDHNSANNDFAKLSQEVLDESTPISSHNNDSEQAPTKVNSLDISDQDYQEFDDDLPAKVIAPQANLINSTPDETATPDGEEEEELVDTWKQQGSPNALNLTENETTQPTIAVNAPNLASNPATNNGNNPPSPVNAQPNSASATPNAGFNANLPGNGSGLMNFFRPGGKNWNQRAVVAGFLIFIFIFSYYFTNKISAKGQNKAGDKTKPLSTRPEEVRSRITNSDLSDSELHPVSESYNQDKGLPPLKLPEGTPTPLPTPTPINAPKAVATPTPTPTPIKLEVEQKDFGIALRAGERASLEKKEPKTDAPKDKVISLKGLRINMVLLEPFRSGITSPITAQVTTSVKDASGKVIIPAYSTVQIPFNAAEINGRVVNDTAANALVKLPDGQEITIKGFVKGSDGYAGLAGKVKGKKSNVLVRTGRASLKALGTIVGIQSGGIGGAVATESINQSIDTTLPYIPTERVVEIPAGTRFTFNVLN